MNIIRLLIVLTALFFWYGPALAADINWDTVGARKITLFYPGVASWEFLNSDDHSLGAKNIRQGKKSCPQCHVSKTGELDVRSNDIAKGSLLMKKTQKPFEPDPLPAKKGFLDLNLQAAYDEEHIYIRLQWLSSGASWNNQKLPEEKLFDMVAIQLNKGQDYFKRYGCFISCHNDLNSMPESPSKAEVKKHPYYGPMKREDVRLYAYYTRNNGWAEMKNEKEVKALLKDNGLIDLWKVEFKGKEVATEDEWIFEDREKDDNGDIKSDGKWENGNYTVVMKRKLQTGDQRDIQLKGGDEVAIGIAVHDKSNHRKHFVSFPMSIGLGADGDIKAEKIK